MKNLVNLIAISLISLILISCSSINKQKLRIAADSLGTGQAGVKIPDRPPQLSTKVPHARLVVGESKVVAIKKERNQTDLCNAKLSDGEFWHIELQKKLMSNGSVI